ncbi:hypothetical protein J2X47_002362 [Sphingomonas sp. BE270]|jgi:hypothetical protein|uniref:hypothetical protein n=1 Tax=unclassified Sphingomonas TaxID=196159 RepID=UPI0010F50F08|nr:MULTISPECIES: hypothetical protein [unclassified Sphingomonas]MDR6848144.1 hypothetical protein [Sphingomonas sp. BE137]MDR7258176.1 hypothetical protein [Sphingomonas sp. BE270]
MARMSRWILTTLLLPVAAVAQNGTTIRGLPDPATINVPDISPSTDPKVRAEGYKFYYFHNPTVRFSEAYQDFAECRAHLTGAGLVKVPGFIPWDESHRRKAIKPVPIYGLVGDIIGDIILPKLERGMRSNKMRRCMGTRGYERYPISETVWKALNEGDEQQVRLMQAKIASGPKPQDAAVTE